MNFPTIVCVLSVFSCTFAKYTLTKFEHCDPKFDYPIKFTAKFKNTTDGQIIEEGGMNSRVDLDDKINYKMDVSTFENGKYELLATLHKRNTCEIIQNYMGEFAYDIQEASGLKKNTCPVPKGDYKLVPNYKIDFDKMNYKQIPSGMLRLKIQATATESNELLCCLDVDIIHE